jgi:hypothetical protein
MNATSQNERDVTEKFVGAVFVTLGDTWLADLQAAVVEWATGG